MLCRLRKHAGTGEKVIESVQNSWFAKLISETLWGFAINEVIHILSVSIMVGAVVAVSIARLRHSAASFADLDRYCRWFFWMAFPVALVSGFLFFAAWPDRYLDNAAFWGKLLSVGLLLPGFQLLTIKSGKFDQLRLVWIVLLIFAFAAIVSGRLMAYLAF